MKRVLIFLVLIIAPFMAYGDGITKKEAQRYTKIAKFVGIEYRTELVHAVESFVYAGLKDREVFFEAFLRFDLVAGREGMIIDNDSLNSFLYFINLLTVSDRITQGQYIEIIYDNDDSGIRMLMECIVTGKQIGRAHV